ncbi:MAG: BseRI endonuclease [Dehalococcoidia bacterium]
MEGRIVDSGVGGAQRGTPVTITAMALSGPELQTIANELARRPGHEAVRTHVWKLLTDGLDIPASDIDHEKRVVTGRIDALLGRTVLEFKRDLRLASEAGDAVTQLRMYMREQRERSGAHYVGIATDGATFVAYELDGEELRELQRYATRRDDGRPLLEWLEGAIAPHADLAPDPEKVAHQLGRDSIAYLVARRELAEIWGRLASRADMALHRDLWSDRLRIVYGSSIDNDDLWYQHTYLTVVAKTMATVAAGFSPLPDPVDLLAGEPFANAGIIGAVESDFFDWVVAEPEGRLLTQRIAQQVARFKLRDVKTDVLKGLYESLIDPQTRHELGEYYTPDWLARKICDRAIDDPLSQRVLDPACGSGTFLFHAIAKYREAAQAAGMSEAATLEGACEHVFGIDVHPVAAIIARVTYLLALSGLLEGPHGQVSIPVYLGDTLQWNLRRVVVEGEIEIGASDGAQLHFPSAVAKEPGTFDAVLASMLDHSERGQPSAAFRAWLDRSYGPSDVDAAALEKTYSELKRLYDEGKDHIWGYVARNLSRPVWLSSTGQRAHVIVGNPPWLSYRYMSPDMQKRFKQECQDRGIWAGGNVATQQDLSGYFFSRCVELYLRAGGLIAFVMPYAAMNRKQFEGFRTGWWGVGRADPNQRARRRHVQLVAEARFEEAWTFDEHVQPLFPVPSCVLFARNASASRLPAKVTRYRGRLKRRNAVLAEADAVLTTAEAQWPQGPSMEGGSAYRERFRNGATMFPRVLCVVERVAAGGLGGTASTPLVRSRRTTLEKEPWRSLSPLQMNVEREALRDLYLGESIAPFRLLEPVLSVVPWDAGEVLDSAKAGTRGLPKLAAWLAEAERSWDAHKSKQTKLTFVQQLDYFGKLSSQFPIASIRVLYSKAGSLPASVVFRSAEALVDHTAYWADARTESEAYFLSAVLNSETARARVQQMQARGQWGARHFDKVMFELPIPEFDGSESLHRELADAAGVAEAVAAAVDIGGMGFVRARGKIREALREDGIAGRIDELVAQLLDGQP